MKSKNIYLINFNSTFSKTDKYLYAVLENEGFNIKKTLFVRDPSKNRSKIITKIVFWRHRLFNAFYLLSHAKRHDIILCWDSHSVAKILGLIFSIFAKRLKVISYNVSADPRRWKKGSMKWRLNRQAFKNIIGTFSSESQRKVYLDVLDLPEWHFHVLQDSLKNHPTVLDTITERADKGYIFSGGGAGRDWNTLIETAKLLPQYVFKVATNSANAAMLASAPKNVEVYCYRYLEFNQLAANSSLCYIPLLGTWQGGGNCYKRCCLFGKNDSNYRLYGHKRLLQC